MSADDAMGATGEGAAATGATEATGAAEAARATQAAPPAVPGRNVKVLVAKLVGLAVVGYVLYWLPTYYQRYMVERISAVMCLAFAVIGLNLLTGYSGQISVGHGAFFGIGAYTVALLVADHDVNHFAALGVAAVLCFLVGLVVGLPALRIRGLYLALVTLGLAALFPQVIQRYADTTGGTQGMRVPRFRAPEGSGLQNDQWTYYVILVLLVVAFVLVRNLVRSRVGRALVATRDNEVAAETMGVNLAFYKVGVFGLSAMLAGIGGALSVFSDPYVNSGKFNIDASIEILVAVVIGGAATTVGPIVGAVVVVFLPTWLPENVPQLSPVLFGATLIVLMMVAPGGVMGLVNRGIGRVKRAWAGRSSPGRPGSGA